MPYIQKAEIALDTEVPCASIERTLRSLRDEGITRVVFSQKERGLTEKLLTILEMAHSLDFRLVGLDGGIEELCQAKTVRLKGVPTILNESARRVIEMVNFYRLDFYSHEAKVHDYIAGRDGNFSKTVLGLKNIHEIYIGLPREAFIESRIGICENNYEHIDDIVLFLSRLQADRIIIRFKNWNLGFSKVLPFIHRAIHSSMMCKIWILIEGIPLCLMTDYVHHVHELYSQIGDGKKLSRCSECCYDKMCNGINPEYLELHGAEEFFPIVDGPYVEEIQKWQKRTYSS